MGTRKRHRGHFCWYCRRVLPNERFSGGGHARHLCKACAPAARRGVPPPWKRFEELFADHQSRYGGRYARWPRWRDTPPPTEKLPAALACADLPALDDPGPWREESDVPWPFVEPTEDDEREALCGWPEPSMEDGV